MKEKKTIILNSWKTLAGKFKSQQKSLLFVVSTDKKQYFQCWKEMF